VIQKPERRLSFSLFKNLHGVSTREKLTFAVQMSTMLGAGIPLSNALLTLRDQIKNRSFRKIIQELYEKVERGLPLSEALSHFPQAFPPLLVSLVRAGEESGNLDATLANYARFLEQKERLRAEVKNALIYPIFLSVLSLGIIIFLLTFVLPKFTSFLEKSQVPLPFTTRLLMETGRFITTSWMFLIPAALLALLALAQFLRSSFGKRLIDHLSLRVPILGDLVRKNVLLRFAQTLSTLLASGVPLLRDLELLREVVGNYPVAREIEKIEDRVRRGGNMAHQMRQSNLFSPLIIQMVAVGEETGHLDKMLAKVAVFYEREIQETLKRLVSALEPVMLVVMALVVGFIAFSLVNTIMKVLQTIH